MGATELPTLRSRAGPPLLLLTMRALLRASSSVLMRLVGVLAGLAAVPTVLLWPKWKSLLPTLECATAWETAPNTRASMTAGGVSLPLETNIATPIDVPGGKW